MGTVGWVGVLTRCMRVYYNTTTSPNIGQPLRNDPQLGAQSRLSGWLQRRLYRSVDATPEGYGRCDRSVCMRADTAVTTSVATFV